MKTSSIKLESLSIIELLELKHLKTEQLNKIESLGNIPPFMVGEINNYMEDISEIKRVIDNY